jgi:hypothetical protein
MNKEYEAKLKDVPTNCIYLNIGNLKNGFYILKITYKNRVLKKITFNKK